MYEDEQQDVLDEDMLKQKKLNCLFNIKLKYNYFTTKLNCFCFQI